MADEEIKARAALAERTQQEAQPVFHLRSHGDVTEAQLVELTSAANSTAPMQPSDLHRAIMNIRCDTEERTPLYALAYRLGHRDCRHAAAELALAAPTQAAGGEAMPVELFDGPGVYRMLKPDAQRRTSAENVSDVLDAVVRLMNRTNDAAPAAAVDWLNGDPNAPGAFGGPPAAAVEPNTFLCRIWGEDIDNTLIALVPDWDGVRRFCVEQWTGSEDATDHDGSLTLDNLKSEFDEHEGDGRGGSYIQQWEIGGVSIERICDCTPPTAAPAAAVEPTCEICEGDPERCDVHDCGDAHHAAAAPEGLTAATEYARNLAVALHRDCYPEVTQWKPLDDLLGLLTQIDNMVSGMARIKSATPDAKAAEGRKPPATLRISADLKALAECVETLSHAAIFVRTREKMHPDGVEMFDRCIDKSLAVLKGRAALESIDRKHGIGDQP